MDWKISTSQNAASTTETATPARTLLGALTIQFHGDEPGSLVISDVLAERTGLRAGDTISFTNVTTEFTSRITGEIHVSNDSLGAIGVAVTRREHVRNE